MSSAHGRFSSHVRVSFVGNEGGGGNLAGGISRFAASDSPTEPLYWTRTREFAMDSAATAFLAVVPTVAMSVGDGETRPPEFAKDSATTAALAVVPTVARSVGDGATRPPEFEKRSTTTESNVAVFSGGWWSWAVMAQSKEHTQYQGYSSRKACWRS